MTRKRTAKQLDADIAAALARPRKPDYLQGPFFIKVMKNGREVTLSDHPTIEEAKRAARKAVAAHGPVDVVELAEGGRYLQGVMDDDGWSRV